MREFLNITKALSDETRVRILMFLRDGELCLCQIIDMLDLAPSTVSRHTTVLIQAGLVELRKEGRWRYYRLAGRAAPRPVREAIRWMRSALEDSPTALKDAKRLKAVIKKDVRVLCDHYKC